MKKIEKGFTLIELLVVIAIIGILAAIVLVSVGSARTSAQDAKVQSTLASLRAQAEIYASKNSGYYQGTAAANVSATPCGSDAANGVFGDATIQKMFTSLGTTKYCSHNGSSTAKATSYAVSVILPSSLTTAWCVDSTGVSRQKTVASDAPADAITTSACN